PLGEWYREALTIIERGVATAENSNDTPLLAAVSTLMFFLPPEKRNESGFAMGFDAEGLGCILALCFISARDLTVRAFAPIVNSLELTHAGTSSDLNIAST